MLDVVMLIVIFFLIGGSFVLHSGVAVDVPTVNSIIQFDPQAHVVTVTPRSADGSSLMTLNGREVSIAELRNQLEIERSSSRQLIIRGDRHALYEDLLKVFKVADDFGYDTALSMGMEEETR